MNHDLTEMTTPVPLADKLIDFVAGGAFQPTGGLGAGCRTCTSGLPTAFANLAAAVSPANALKTV